MSIVFPSTAQLQYEHIHGKFENVSVGNGTNVAKFDVAEIQGSRENMEDTHITLDTSVFLHLGIHFGEVWEIR